MNFQGLVNPNGLPVHLDGPYCMPQNNICTLTESSVLTTLEQHAIQLGLDEGDPLELQYFQIYSDSAYGVSFMNHALSIPSCSSSFTVQVQPLAIHWLLDQLPKGTHLIWLLSISPLLQLLALPILTMHGPNRPNYSILLWFEQQLKCLWATHWPSMQLPQENCPSHPMTHPIASLVVGITTVHYA